MEKDNKHLAIVLLVVLSLIWGTSFILIKQGLKALEADQVGALRITAASLFLMPFAILRIKELTSKDVLKLFFSGLIGLFFPAFLFAQAQTNLSSSLAGVLNSLSPVWTMIIGAAFFKQRFRGWAILGVFISFGGSILLALSRSGGVITGFNYYALLIVLACAMYGTNLNFLKFKVSSISPMTITSVSLLLIGPLAAFYLFACTDFMNVLQTKPGAWRATSMIVLLAFMGTAMAHLLFYKLLKVSTPMMASSVTYIMPIVAVVWGLIDGEQLLLGHVIGMLTILIGVYLANKK